MDCGLAISRGLFSQGALKSCAIASRACRFKHDVAGKLPESCSPTLGARRYS